MSTIQPPELVDTHSHLQSSAFDDDREAVIERALQAGVTRLIVIGAGTGAGFEATEKAIELATRYPFIWATAGIHPNDADFPLDIERLRHYARHPRVVAIGETGLDFFRTHASPEGQDRWFRAHVAIAREVQKPLVIHSRDAGQQCLTLLRETGAHEAGGVFHCFAEDAGFAEELRKINFKVSFPGTVTFKKADELRAIIKDIPLAQLFVETDAPYLSPEPHRGKRCESSFVVSTARRIAEVKGMEYADFARATTDEAVRFFNLK